MPSACFTRSSRTRACACIGVEAAGDGIETGHHAAPLCAGKPGVLHGNRTYLMEDDDGQIIETHSVSAGLDYPGVGPEHAWLKDIGRAELRGDHRRRSAGGFPPADAASKALSRRSNRATPWPTRSRLAATMKPEQRIIVNLSGRGDKDINTVARIEGIKL